MALQAQDVLVALKIALLGECPKYRDLASSLGLSLGEAHKSVKRAIDSGLLSRRTRAARRGALREFLVHGLKYVFPVKPGADQRGIPTAHAAPPLKSGFPKSDRPPVWPDSQGPMTGPSIKPLYKSVPEAIRQDPQLYEALALIDALRIGRARERKLAQLKLEEMLT